MNADFTSASEPIARLIEEFNRLPGIGPKSAQRLTYHLLQAPQETAEALADAIRDIKENVSLCSICFNITDSNPCAICRDKERDHSKICVVEEAIDILPLERTKKYHGLYHVLHGVISPSDGVSPEDLKTGELLSRLNTDSVITYAAVATDDRRIYEAVQSFGGQARMTSERHRSGTDRKSVV